MGDGYLEALVAGQKVCTCKSWCEACAADTANRLRAEVLALRRAVKEERRRCASIAMNWEPTDGDPGVVHEGAGLDVVASIAAAIRNQEDPPVTR